MVVLAFVVALVFGTFLMSTRLFNSSATRQSAEVEFKAIAALLKRDLEHTNFWLCQIHTRASSPPYRDGLALAALDDWDAASSFDPVTGRPAWNRYIVWYATSEPDRGRLIRQIVQPSPPPTPFIQAPYSGLSANMNDDPASNSDVFSSRILSQDVEEFRISQRLENGTYRVQLKLHKTGGRRGMGTEQTEETLDITSTYKPKNTWPAI